MAISTKTTSMLLSAAFRARFAIARPLAVQKAFYTEGAIPRGGGAFSEKENAIENKYIHEQEMLKIQQLKEKLAKAQESIDSTKKELDEHIEKQKKSQ
ncbi:hypothetical protein BJ085DRAFT_40263 [Dimargaris cristalligena]|uniref:ATPase inhibitor, mitochondrial n=1 Tax=Dimargaris cristalligena TaxID=215637 RepID=A0A4P9ZNL3_9FUNG|nr:hypothetical protein BJ085DRAFT_40263 [Dimargaris cristalligena]|eukprot:RKP34883.1 hypothetical protein BJ085DRAFT_40263 [Dimargaris cristalligena]